MGGEDAEQVKNYEKILDEQRPYLHEDPITLSSALDESTILLPCHHKSKDSDLEKKIMSEHVDKGIFLEDQIVCVKCQENKIIVTSNLISFLVNKPSFGIISKEVANIISNIEKGLPDNKFEWREELTKCRKCNYMLFTPVKTTRFTCPKCNENYCTQCNQEPHENCALAQEKQRKAFEDMRKAGVKICPHCNSASVKKSGCNFIYCSSEYCHGLKYFCYLCECKLSQAKHTSHFNEHPYDNNCKGVGDAAE